MELCKDLMVAAKAGDEDEAKRTIDEGVDMNYQNEFGQSAMMVASWEGHLGIVEALLNDGADPNLQDGVRFYVTGSELLIFFLWDNYML
ncbi:Caseinolytic peptidase B protein-like [Stylophora pistillata]|uniref:Caseinolytic peptidase B protein-like n=1 Tax=Stylophora pistillata TaxID=50429 RepID=A0A2B4PVG9_STYPI|nr:Caseinolytic peptidase B protein-like [Stylophora pistillata]